ncbi:MAG: hypothetical protein JO171_05265 [Paludibacterium sp.]|uniref:hypothetical protein n=1 Tax=Paludibacterium sp. TaxID=1917523 RepID=UPI0025D0D03F|nr:hypothetical protein [Paludibacterium sp.]MBV8046537.1 hypothetical protein [Paludibacterium sp.]MBV8646766.1 hypothetical protein [Paludibacterium sp.]
MTAKEREQRKTLLLIKGDALRLQLGLEIQLLQRHWSLVGALSRLMPQAVGLWGSGNSAPRGLWRLARLVLGALGLWRGVLGWLRRN